MEYTLTGNELKLAYLDYNKIRENDLFLYKLQNDFSAYIYDHVGSFPRNNGSFGLWLNHNSSDLDLCIGVTEGDRPRVTQVLSSIGNFVAVRRSTADSDRYVYKFERDGVIIDLGVLPPRDFELTIVGMNNCRANMTEVERVSHVWQKKKLLEEGRHKEYLEYKLSPYKQYFSPLFIFVPIKDTPKSPNQQPTVADLQSDLTKMDPNIVGVVANRPGNALTIVVKNSQNKANNLG